MNVRSSLDRLTAELLFPYTRPQITFDFCDRWVEDKSCDKRNRAEALKRIPIQFWRGIRLRLHRHAM